jgi:hypothetical protein
MQSFQVCGAINAATGRDPLVQEQVPNLGLFGRHSPALPYRGGEVLAVAERAHAYGRRLFT